MSLALIQESAKEVRRLAIAGSPLAVGDFRLKKLAAPLEQAGAKVPVFAQVAKAINDVVNGKEADSAANLLNLSTLLNAILYTQGQSSAEGEMRELETFASNSASTRTPARLLKPLVQALTSTGSGRFETVKSAVERGAFNDLRLIDPAIQALGDVYPELADLVAEKILPGYGPGIVPLLESGFDLKGKKTDARRLQIMHELDPAGTLPLCKTALEDGSPEVKVAAIACLGKHEDCLPLVLEQANAKNKQLRAAALESLAEHDSPEVTQLFAEAIKGKALDILVGPFRNLRNSAVLAELLNEGRRVFALLLKGESETIPRFLEILNCVEARLDAIKEAEVGDFLLGCFTHCEKLVKLKAAKNGFFGGAELQVSLTNLLYQFGSSNALDAIIAKREVIPVMGFDSVLGSALRRWPADKVFDEFSSLLNQKRGAGKDKFTELEDAFRLSLPRQFKDFDDEAERKEVDPVFQQVNWDARWLDAAIKADQPLSVCYLARPGHKGALNYLRKQLEPKGQCQPDAVAALARCECPQVTDRFIDLVKAKAKGAKQFDWELQQLFSSARFLPRANLDKLDAFAAKLNEKFVDHFLEALAPLRTTNQPTDT
jgi:hypothetical protein